jgi:hypothetical protein
MYSFGVYYATCHTSNETMTFLREFFDDCLSPQTCDHQDLWNVVTLFLSLALPQKSDVQDKPI